MSRRRLLGAAGAGITGSALLSAACSGSDDKQKTAAGGAATSSAGTQATEAPPRVGGTLRFVNTADAHISPFHGGGAQGVVGGAIYDAAWRVLYTGNDYLFLRAAAKVEQPDEVTYVTALRPAVFRGIPPVSGRAVSGEDWKVVLQFIKSDRTTVARNFVAEKITQIDVPDPLTVRITTNGPQAYFFEEGPSRAIVPKELMEKDLKQYQPPVGSGPWQWDRWTVGSVLEFKRFDKYHRAPEPYIERLRATLIVDESAEEAAFRSNQLDIWGPPNLKAYERVLADMGSQVVGAEDWGNGDSLALNIHRDPFKDERVRKAFYRMLNRQQLLNVISFGKGKVIGPVGPDFSRYMLPDADVAEALKFDAREAKQLLDQAGFPYAKTFDFLANQTYNNHVPMAALVKDQLAAVGVKVNMIEVPHPEYVRRFNAEPGDFDMALTVFNRQSPARLIRDHHTTSGAARENLALEDPEIDALIEKNEQTVNEEQRRAIILDIQRRLLRKWSNHIPIFFGRAYQVRRAEVKGWKDDFGVYQTWTWLDR